MDFLAAIRRESDRFYATADTADPSRRVPGCPDWSIADLVWHLGECHWFWGTDIEARATNPDDIEKAKPARPDGDYRDLIAWGRAQADRMVQLLETTPDDVAVWTWALRQPDQNVGFIRRHQVQEAAVHRWDIQSAATGAPDPIDANVASDSIDEFLAITLPWCVRPDKPLPGTVHLHCTDTDGEWFVHADGRVEPIHAKGDVAIRGTASDLLLAIYTRIPVDQLDVIGDATLARRLVEVVNTE
ncbi:MAG: maleylpyruvate isomerase N-terminal domain-containing protein [Acidimicrobiales bacterium]